MHVNGVIISDAEIRLRQRLNDPGTAELLLQVLDRLDVLALTLNSMDGLLRRSDTIIENIAGSVRDVRQNAPAMPLDAEKTIAILSQSLPQLVEALPHITQSLPQLLALSDRLNDQATAVALQTLLDKIELVAFGISALDAFLQRSDTIIESIAKSVHDVRKNAPGGEMEMISNAVSAMPQLAQTLPLMADRLPQLLAVATQVQTVLESPEIIALMSSGIFSPETIFVISHAGDALVESYNASKVNPQQIGLMGLLRALGDPDVQRGLGFLVDFGKRFGQQLDKNA